MTRRLLAPLLALSLALPACATVQTHPTTVSVSQTRLTAIRVADGIQTGLSVLRIVGAQANNADLDRAIIAATGTTAAPGPLPKALDALGTVTADPDLHTTAQAALDAFRPVLDKLTGSLTGYGAILRQALSALATYLGVIL